MEITQGLTEWQPPWIVYITKKALSFTKTNTKILAYNKNNYN